MKNRILILGLLLLSFVGVSQTRTTSGNAIRKEINAKFVNGLVKQYTIAKLRQLRPSSSDSSTVYYSTDTGKEGLWKIKAGSTEADNLGTLLVCANGMRLGRIIENGKINVKWFGAKGDAKYSSLASISTNSAVLTISDGKLTSEYVGKYIRLYAGGASGSYLETTILSVQSATQCTLATTSQTTITNGGIIYGLQDETSYIQSAIDFANSQLGGIVYIPTGRYLISSTLYLNPTSSSIPLKLTGDEFILSSQDAWAVRCLGTSLIKFNDGDFIKVNQNSSGVGVLTYPFGANGITISNLSFVGNTSNQVVGVNCFRSRIITENLNGHRVNYVIKQNITDASSNQTYCDGSRYINTRVSWSKEGGIKLNKADASKIDGFVYENPVLGAKYGIEIENSTTVSISNLIHGLSGTAIPTTNTGFVSIKTSQGISINNVHAESCNLENIFYFSNVGAVSVSNIFTFIANNNTFKLSYVKGLKVNNWYSYETKNSGYVDFDFGTTSGWNSNITWSNTNLYDPLFTPSDDSHRRQMTFLNPENRGVLYEDIPYERGVTSLDAIEGNKIFATNTTISGIPASESGLNGFQFVLNGNPLYKSQLASASGQWYRRGMSNGTWGAWRKVVDESSNGLQMTGDIQFQKTIRRTYTNKTANYTLGAFDYYAGFDCTSGNLLCYLPLASASYGYEYTIKKTDASGNSLKLVTQGSDVIDGLATGYFLYNKDESVQIYSDGVRWITIGTGKRQNIGNATLMNGVVTISTTASTPNSSVFPVTKTIIGTSAHAYTYNVSTAGTLVITARQANGNVETGCNSIISYWIAN